MHHSSWPGSYGDVIVKAVYRHWVSVGLSEGSRQSLPVERNVGAGGGRGARHGIPVTILGGSLCSDPQACTLVSGGTCRLRTTMPHPRGRLGAWEGGTNLDGGVLQPEPGTASRPPRSVSGRGAADVAPVA